MKIVAFLVVNFVLCAHLNRAVVIRDYNKVNFESFDTLASLKEALFTRDPADDNVDAEKLADKNVLLGVADEDCFSQLESPAFRGAQRHAGGDIMNVATLPKIESPIEFSECSKVFFYRVGTDILSPSATQSDFSHAVINPWIGDLMRTSFVITNKFNFTVEIYWVEESNEPKFTATLLPGEDYNMGSFLGHIFSAQKQNTSEIVDYFVVSGENYDLHPVNRLETCDFDGQAKFIDGISFGCEDMNWRLDEFSNVVWYEKRLGLNFVQPQLVEPVTEAGFENIRLPDKTFKWLKEWYDIEKAKEHYEGPVGPCMNQHKAPSQITHLPDREKERLSNDLQDILEDWYGGALTLTSIYGIRKYVNGSVLRMHVDTVNTHVVSAIINVDQEVEKDWPLVILDHDDNEHRVIMRPGDMLLYESAKLLHGRPDSFIGHHYDNIFIHYKPVKGWNYQWL